MRVFLVMLSACCALLATACNNSGGSSGGRRVTEIVQYPHWQYTDYKRLGIVPMKATDRKAREPAAAASASLTSDLARSGYFDVVSTAEMKDILKEQDLSRLSDVADPTTEIPAGRIKRAQALVIGVITDFETREDHEKKRQPHLTLDAHNRPRTTYTNVTEYRTYARVGGTVNIVDTTTGKVLFSHNVPAIEAEDSAINGHPEQSADDLAMKAAQSLAVAFYKAIAPQRTRVKFEAKNLQIALNYFEGRYETLKSVPADAAEFMVVVTGLPADANGNHYEVKVSAAGGREYLAQQEFTWSSGLGQRGHAFTVPTSVLEKAGGDRFVAKLFASGNDEPVLTREFTLASAKQE